MSKDHFQCKAGDYDQDKNRVKNIENIANAILDRFDFSPSSHILDFGSGTGLLLEQIAPYVEKITAIDVSISMNKVLGEKSAGLSCDLEIVNMDLTKVKLDTRFDGIISSMTMHHIQDIQPLLVDFHHMLNENGFIALADLELEDGSFHTDNTGVFHFGFKRESFLKAAKAAGFKDLTFRSVSIAHKPQGDYPIFLLTGRK